MRVLLPDLPPFHRLKLNGLEAVFYSRDHLPQGQAEGMVLWFLPAQQRRELLGRPGLRWVLTLTAGIDHVATGLPAGVTLYNAHELHDKAVAQHALGLMLAAGRGLHRFRDAQRERRWVKAGAMHTLEGREVVIWGQGHIGRLLAGMLEPLGARVSGLTFRSTPVEVEAALRRADDLLMLLPSTPATRHILDAGRLALLRPQCWVYNLGRGELIDPSALHIALSEGRLGGVALDVTEPEPLPPGDPLWDLPNVILTPHVGSTTDDLIERGAGYAAGVLERLLAGDEVPGRVDLGRGY